MKRSFYVLPALVAALMFSVGFAQFQPRNVECIAPSDPGGGWDFTCRQMAPLLVELGLVPGAIRSQNMAGAGGAIAFASVVSNQKGNENLLVAASTATTSRIAAGEFAGFSADDVRWVAALGADDGVIAVRADSEYQTLEDLIAAWNADARSVSVVGASSVGGWDHLKVLLLADAAGIPVRDVRYTSFSSGGPAIIEVIAGRADVFTGDISEALAQIEAGNLKAIALLAESRLDTPLTADVPTALEAGYDVIAPNWRGFYLPPGISDEAYDWWADAFRQMAESEQWAALREQSGIGDFRRFGPEMEAFAHKQVDDIVQLLTDIGAR